MSEKRKVQDYYSQKEVIEKENYRGKRDYDSYDKRTKRLHVEENRSTISILQSLLIQIGEKSHNSLESNLDDLSKHISESIPLFKTQIVEAYVSSIIELPHKITIYSTLLGLINVKEYDFVQFLLDYLVLVLLPQSLKEVNIEKCQLLLFFLVDCVNTNVVLPSSILSLYEVLISVLDKPQTSQNVKDTFVSFIMKSLPYGSKEIFRSEEKELQSILDSIQCYLSNRQKSFIGSFLSVWNDPKTDSSDFITTLLSQFNDFKESSFSEKSIYRIYYSFENELCSSLQHSLCPLVVPEYTFDHHVVFPYPTVQFRLFEPNDIPSVSEPELPKSLSIDRFILEEQIRIIIEVQHCSRVDCLKSLVSIPLIDKFPLEYILVEVLLGEIFRLPLPKQKLIFYFVLLLDLSKLSDFDFFNVIMFSFEILYDKLEIMDLECQNRFSVLFSWYFSNHNFKWNWNEWKDCLVNKNSNQLRFVRNVLQKCVSYSYYDRIDRIIPQEISSLLPSIPKPNFLFESNKEHSSTSLAKSVVDAMRNKASIDELKVLLSDIQKDEDIPESFNEKSLKEFKVFFTGQCLLFAGSKSYSHLISTLERYLGLLNEVCNDCEEGKVQILQSLFLFWNSNPSMLAIMVERFIAYRVIDPPSVINFIFSPNLLEQDETFQLWHILLVTMDKIVVRTNQIRKDLESTEKDLECWELQKETEDKQHWESEKDVIFERIKKLRKVNVVITKEHKIAFVTLFQRFLIAIQELPSSKQTLLSHLNYFLRRYCKDISSFINSLDTLLFQNSQIPEVLTLFNRNKLLLS